jgi:hypothetical protein
VTDRLATLGIDDARFGGKATVEDGNLVRPLVPGSTPSMSAMVWRSRTRPTGTGSAPIAGSRHEPSIAVASPPYPGWTSRSRTMVEPGFASVVISEPHSRFVGTPVGRRSSRSPVLATRTSRPG